jgi:hypothetical protein
MSSADEPTRGEDMDTLALTIPAAQAARLGVEDGQTLTLALRSGLTVLVVIHVVEPEAYPHEPITMRVVRDWRRVWREGFVPLLPLEGLRALQAALASNDPALLQGQTTVPPALAEVQDWPVEAACATTYCGWKGLDLGSVLKADEYFAQVCFDVDETLDEPAGCRHFLNWYDETPRDQMRRELLPEVQRAIALKERDSVRDPDLADHPGNPGTGPRPPSA